MYLENSFLSLKIRKLIRFLLQTSKKFTNSKSTRPLCSPLMIFPRIPKKTVLRPFVDLYFCYLFFLNHFIYPSTAFIMSKVSPFFSLLKPFSLYTSTVHSFHIQPNQSSPLTFSSMKIKNPKFSKYYKNGIIGLADN